MAKLTRVNKLGLQSVSDGGRQCFYKHGCRLAVFLSRSYFSLLFLGDAHGKRAASRIIPNKSWLKIKKKKRKRDYNGLNAHQPIAPDSWLAVSASAHTRAAFMFQRRLEFEPRGRLDESLKEKSATSTPPSQKKEKKSIDQMYDVIWSNWQTQKL